MWRQHGGTVLLCVVCTSCPRKTDRWTRAFIGALKTVQLLPPWCLPGPSDQKPPHSVWAGGRQAVSCFTGNKQALRLWGATTVPSTGGGQGIPGETEVALPDHTSREQTGQFSDGSMWAFCVTCLPGSWISRGLSPWPCVPSGFFVLLPWSDEQIWGL